MSSDSSDLESLNAGFLFRRAALNEPVNKL